MFKSISSTDEDDGKAQLIGVALRKDEFCVTLLTIALASCRKRS